MKWIGQHIFDFAVRIRNKLYDSSASAGTSNQVLTSTGSAVEWKTLSTLGGSDKNYVHSQDVASNTWEVEHSLNKYPSVTVVDSAGTVVVGNVEYDDIDNVTLTFFAGGDLVAFSGKAYFN